MNFWDTLFWGGGNSAAEWGQKGFSVVLSLPDYLYLDFPNEVHPEERGYCKIPRMPRNTESRMCLCSHLSDILAHRLGHSLH